MIHCVLHDPNDSVAVVVVEGIKAGQTLTGLILDEDRTIDLRCTQDIPLGHKIALKDLNVGDTVIKYGVDIGKVVAPIKAGQHAHVHDIKTKHPRLSFITAAAETGGTVWRASPHHDVLGRIDLFD